MTVLLTFWMFVSAGETYFHAGMLIYAVFVLCIAIWTDPLQLDTELIKVSIPDDQRESLRCMGEEMSIFKDTCHKGNPFDNAQAESFIKTLKNEEVYL